ncbi:MAG: hypothetical protein GX639_09285 [Fibrobacter sp.]|nr:hypothetical protein [Fibrobacter sp.]
MKYTKLLSLVFIVISCSYSDITLLNQYSHKTHFSLEQLVFKADYILEVKKDKPITNKKVISFGKETKCPPYTVISYNFVVQDVVKGDSKILNGQRIKVKEPFSDMAYTMHYSYYTKGFMIEPFLGMYTNGIPIDSMETMFIFVDNLQSNDPELLTLQFSILNASDRLSQKDTIQKILNRPPGDMKRMFLKKK